MATFEEVISALEGEHRYQSKWQDLDKLNNVGDFIIYMQNYLDEARRANNPAKPEASLDIIRKVSMLGVAAMMQHGVVHREGF